MLLMGEFDRIERRISLHDVRVLMTVVQAGSMGKAARRLATSQPAISRSIAELEDALGVRLLDRNPQGIEPTAYGRAPLKRGLVVFDELMQGVKDIRFLADPSAGELRIGASIAVAAGFVSSIIDRLSRRFPRLAFQVLATDTATAYRALVERRGSAGCPCHRTDCEEHMDAEVLFHDPHVVVAECKIHGPGAAGSAGRSDERALDSAWRMRHTRGVLRLSCQRTRFSRTVATATLPVRTALLATGRYLSMVPEVVLQFPAKSQTLRRLPIDLPTTLRPLAIITLKNRTLNPVAQLFAEFARSCEAAGMKCRLLRPAGWPRSLAIAVLAFVGAAAAQPLGVAVTPYHPLDLS